MCLREPFQWREQKGKRVLLSPSPKTIKRDKPAAAGGEQQMLLPLKPGRGGEACAILVKDLLCGEALSPYTHCPARMATHQPAAGGLHNVDHNAAKVVRWFEKARPLSPSLNLGSSFQSKTRDNSPCYLHQHKPFCGDIAMTVARRDPPNSRPTFEELGEAMRVLQKREAKSPYRLTDRYIDTLMGSGTTFNVELSSVRRDCVFLIFKLVEAFGLRKLIAAHAVAYLDRFLNTLTSALVGETLANRFQFVATACVSIAAKMDDTAAPSLASLSRFCGEGNMGGKGGLRDMEAVVLQVLGWDLLAVTTSDYLDNMLAHLPLSGVPSVLVQNARSRADELMQSILTEVEFLDFEPSIIGLCVMQCILDETLPLQAALHMAVMQTFFAVDMHAAQQCYKMLVDLVVDPLPTCSATSPDSVLHS